MVCFCKQSVVSLEVAVDALAAAEFIPPPESASARRVQSVARWVESRSLAQPPWQPDPSWLGLALPQPKLRLPALATLGALAQVRAQTMAMFNIDLLAGGTATPLVRLVATLNARLSAMAQAGASARAPGPVAARLPAIRQALQMLAAQADAAETVTQAAEQNLFSPTDQQLQAYTTPGGVPLEQWQPFLAALAALSPLIALSIQLGEPEPAGLASAVRTLRGIEVPALAHVSLVLQLTAVFSAAARLQTVLGVNVFETGLARVAGLAAQRVDAAARRIPSDARPPRVSTCPTQQAAPAVVTAAMSPEIAALASLTWKVPSLTSLTALPSLMPALGLCATLTPIMGAPVRLQPCTAGCDAAVVLRTI